jgi:hypothetical protein
VFSSDMMFLNQTDLRSVYSESRGRMSWKYLLT